MAGILTYAILLFRLALTEAWQWFLLRFARAMAACGVAAPRGAWPEEVTVVCDHCGMAKAAATAGPGETVCAHLEWAMWLQRPAPLSLLRREGLRYVCFPAGGRALAVDIDRRTLTVWENEKERGSETVSGYAVGWEGLAKQADEIAGETAEEAAEEAGEGN
jgi:hypothetical protein